MNKPDIRITRTSEQDGKQTVGTLVVPDTSFHCMTLELPWKSNENNVSCILPKPKEIKKYDYEVLQKSPSFDYEHIWIRNVPNRSFVKIHAGNIASGNESEIEGCILVGDSFRDINADGALDILNSRETLQKLIDKIPKKGVIEIVNQVGYY